MLRWKTRPRRPGETYVVLEGDLTEGDSLRDLQVDGNRVVFNLSRVRYVNSEGSRRLLNFLEALPADDIVAELCSPVIVDLVNMVPVFAERMTIESVIVPTECPECFHESDVRVHLQVGGGVPALELGDCEECGALNELGVIEDRYFAFLKQ